MQRSIRFYKISKTRAFDINNTFIIKRVITDHKDERINYGYNRKQEKSEKSAYMYLAKI